MLGRGGELVVLGLDEEERRLRVVELVRSSGAARRHESGSSISAGFAQAKNTITCSGELPVSVATRSPR